MQMIKAGALAALALLITGTAACSRWPFLRAEPSMIPAGAPPTGGVAEFQVTRYDGRFLQGRVLIGATAEPLMIDRRLVEWVGVQLENVRACDTEGKRDHLVFEKLPPPPQPEDIVMLPPGHWYGAEVRFWLFDEKLGTQPGPECFEADLTVRNVHMQTAATLPIRVSRTGDDSTALDAGSPVPGRAATPG